MGITFTSLNTISRVSDDIGCWAAVVPARRQRERRRDLMVKV
jgi:hypothetical protein